MEKQLEKKNRSYEISFLLRSEEDVQTVVRHLSDRGAEIVAEGAVEKIRLAYPIEKENEAFFGYIHFAMDPAEIVALHDAMQLDKKVIRFLIVTPAFVKSTKRRLGGKFTKEAVKAEPEAVVESAPATVHEDISNDVLEKALKEMEK